MIAIVWGKSAHIKADMAVVRNMTEGLNSSRVMPGSLEEIALQSGQLRDQDDPN